MSQTEFASKFNISNGMVSNYENGKNPQPIHLLINLSRESGYNLVWISTGEGAKTYHEAIERSISKALNVSESKSQYGQTDSRLQEIIDFCLKDSDTLDTFWHFIKAKKGFRSL